MLLLAGLLWIPLVVFAQTGYQMIRVSNDIELIKLSEHAFVHVSYADMPPYGRVASNGLVFINGREAFLLDTPVNDSLTEQLMAWLKDSLRINIVGFVPNHWHEDCMGGLGFLQRQKIESYANQMTIDIAKGKNLPVPAFGFRDSLSLSLGGKVIQCYYMGAAHSLDNIVVWIPSEQILFAGCMIKSLNSKDLGNTADGDLVAYPQTIDKVLKKFPVVKWVIPGHGAFGGRELITHTKELALVFPFEQVREHLVSYYLMREPGLMNEPAAQRVTGIIKGLQQNEVVGDQVILELYQKGSLDYNRAKELLASIGIDGSWKDINYADTNRSGWDPKKHSERVLFLTKVYLTPESPLLKSERLSQAIHLALKFWFDSGLVCSNWWYNQIGIPKTFGPVFIMLEKELSEQEREGALKVMNMSQFGMTGQNKVWLAGNVLMRALLTNDAALALQARDQIFSEITMSSGEGIQADFSFHQHGPQQQFANYGLSFVSNTTFWGRLFQGTTAALDASQTKILRDFLLSAYNWMVWKGSFDINGLGRQLFRDAQQTKALATATTMLDMTLIDPAFKRDYLDFIDRNYAVSGGRVLNGNLHFWRSDQTIHRSAGWFASVKMSSTRVIGTESVNGDNLKGYYLADGATYIMVDGQEYRDIFPVWDWKKIPGVTSYQNAEPLKVLGLEGYRNQSDFTGGVSSERPGGVQVGDLGVSATHLERDSLSAKKAWFFVNDMMLCLGAEINSPFESEVATTLNQCLLKGPVTYFDGARKIMGAQTTLSAGNIRWVFHRSVGYYFLAPASVALSNRRQVGDWHDIISSAVPERDSADVFTLSWDHGPKPVNGSYAYAVIPNISLEKLASLSLSVEVLRNDGFCQGIISKDKLVLMMVIHKRVNLIVPQVGAFEMLTPGCYLFEKNSRGWSVSLSDPTQKRDKLSFRKDGKLFEVSLPVEQNAGMTVHVRLD